MPDYAMNALGQPIGVSLPTWQPPSAPSYEPMSGRFCRLEALDADCHAADLFAANAEDRDGRNWTYLAYGPFATLHAFSEWVARVSGKEDTLFYAIVDARTRKSIGVAAYLRVDSNAGSIEVGHINYSPLLQRTLAATEAMYLMMERAFELGYRRYEWKCDALNAPSRAAAERLGFSYEGIFRQATVYKGRNRDTAWFATIDLEWPALRKAFLTWLDPANFDEWGKQRTSLRQLTAPVVGNRRYPSHV
jgi:RimJ/RimL family protein N-acetyltransferase